MTAAGAPDVTVIVPVYNTISYLRECLDSLVSQSIGAAAMRVVAVDDGSTDGSGELLDEYAERHPGLFDVVHQENSGGPARPCNVGLEHATGRYVFFLGSDDHLGPEALARMVAKADEWRSDVVCVKLVGTNGREVGHELFRENDPDIAFPDQRPYLTANTKLFRRSVIEEHQVRYQEDIRIASDQTFTIEAMYRSERISVLGDYDYYYALLRPEGGNVMYSGGWRDRLDAIEMTMAYVARLIAEPDVRDAVLVRHFRWEYAARLARIDDYGDDVPELAARTRTAIETYATPGLRRLLPVAARLRLHYLEAGDLDALRTLNEFEEAGGLPAVVVRADRVFLAYPGFGERYPDEVFELTHEMARARFAARLEVTALEWDGAGLTVSAHSLLTPESAEDIETFVRRRVPRDGDVTPGVELVGVTPATEGCDLRLRVGCGPVLQPGAEVSRWIVSVRPRGLEELDPWPLLSELEATTTVRSGRVTYELAARSTANGRLVVVIQPQEATTLAGKLSRKVLRWTSA